MKSIHKLISPEQDKENKRIQEKIKKAFGINISYVQATKINAYKTNISTFKIDSEKLIEILGGKVK
jgi:hypothetical protein